MNLNRIPQEAGNLTRPAKGGIENPDFVSTIDELSLWSAPFGLKLLDTVEMKKNMAMLDLGCGLGFPLIELAERMPFSDCRFDLIVSNNGVNNVQNMAQTFRECRRVAKPGAQMVLTLNLDQTMKEFYDVFIQVLKERGLMDEIEKTRLHIYAKRRPLDEIRRMLDESGFFVRKVIHDTFRFRYADGTAMPNHGMIKYWFAEAWKGVLKPADVQPVFETVENRFNKQALTGGGMTLTVPFVTLDCAKGPDA
jgi:hypothetical protein